MKDGINIPALLFTAMLIAVAIQEKGNIGFDDFIVVALYLCGAFGLGWLSHRANYDAQPRP